MIYTITFNPALDYITQVENFKTGEINRTKTETILPGGKGLNVSIVLKNLGIENTALGFVAGFTGEELIRKLETQGVKTDFVKVKDGITRINVKISSVNDNSVEETALNGMGPQITKENIESPNIYTQDLIHLPQQLREAIKTKRDYEILAAMGIPGLGSVQARRIIEQCAFTVLGEQTMSTYSILVSTALGIKDQTVLNIISSSAFANEVNALAKLEYIKTETLDPVTRYLRDSHTNEGTSTDRTATYISRLLKDTGFLGFNGRKER